MLVPTRRSRSGRWSTADTALVLFDPPRLFYDRERALWTPEPAQLLALARWLRACGVRTLAIVLPHAHGRLPEALKRGLASLDEQAVAALGFERLLVVRSAQKPAAQRHANPAERLAHWMLSISRFMVPPSEQPVRAVQGGRTGRRRLAHRAARHPRRGARAGVAGGAGRVRAVVRERWLGP